MDHAGQKIEKHHENPSEPAAKTGEKLKHAHEKMPNLQKLRQVVLKEKSPIINATEKQLQTTAVTINKQHPQAKVAAPDFYQAA